MQSQSLRDELRGSLDDVCEAMRAHQQALDRTAEDFRRTTHNSRQSLKLSYMLLSRLDGQTEPQETPAAPAVVAR